MIWKKMKKEAISSKEFQRQKLNKIMQWLTTMIWIFSNMKKEEPRLKKRDEVDVYLDKTQTTNSDLQKVFQNLPTLKTLFLKIQHSTSV